MYVMYMVCDVCGVGCAVCVWLYVICVCVCVCKLIKWPPQLNVFFTRVAVVMLSLHSNSNRS